MRLSEAKNLFLSLAKTYFSNAVVAFGRQSRVPKPDLALVSLTFGNVHRPLHPVAQEIDGHTVGNYLSRISVTVDLFTHGLPVCDDETGMVIAHEDTAVEDMLSFQDFLGSEYVINWCGDHDVAVLADGDAKDLTGIVNDTNYEFRSQLVVSLYFTQKAVGYAGVLDEGSIKYPTGDVDENGDPTYSTEEPKGDSSITGSGAGDTTEGGPIVDPITTPSSSGGGSEELAGSEAGYFTEAEVKEDTGNG